MLPIHHILLPTDFSSGAEQALDQALLLARHTKATLHLLHVVVLPASSLPNTKEDFYRSEAALAQREMDALLKKRNLSSHPVSTGQGDGESGDDSAQPKITFAVRPGHPAMPTAPVILEYAEEHDIDLIVIGTRGRRGVTRLLMGSVTEEVMRAATCPVLGVRMRKKAAGESEVKRILVPLDLSDVSLQALAHATALAALYEARIVLLHVLEDYLLPSTYWLDDATTPPVERPDALRSLEKRAQADVKRIADETTRAGIPIDYEVAHGYPATTIIDYAAEHDIDLIVIASHGRTGLDRFLIGSVAEKVLRQAPCPVYILRADISEAAPNSDASAETSEA